MREKLSRKPVLTTYQDMVEEFSLCASLCHECVAEKDVSGLLNFHGPSPDEIAICKGMSAVGCKVVSQQSTGEVDVDFYGQTRRFKIAIVSLV